MYGVQRSTNGNGWDVVRNAPTVVSIGLKQAEAEALALALNAQVKHIERPQQ